MTTLRPLRGGSPAFDVIVDGRPVALVTMARPAPAYERLARRPGDTGAIFLWHAYLFGEAWKIAEPNNQALFVGSYDRLATAVEDLEFLHDRRTEAHDDEAAADDYRCHFEERESVPCPICEQERTRP